MLKLKNLLLFSLFFAGAYFCSGQNKPFPQALNFPNCIKPSNVTQAAMNTSVSNYYTYWKGKYLKNDLASLPGGYYVKGEITGGADGYTPLGSSEGQGYGMLISVMMAGYDANAQTIFNGLFKTARAFKSSINANLMGWVVADAAGAQGHFDSATDGDMDIAYALILAHYQWGSGGTINYLNEAKNMITNGIKVSYVTNGNRLNLGDWDSKTTTNTRPSDWMLSHLKAFKDVTGDVVWDNVATTTYGMISGIQTNYSSATGLMPDFATGNPIKPAAPDFLESENDGDYYYNASRTPLRFVMDYAHYGNASGKTAVNKIVTWAKTKTNNIPTNFRAGYTLAGNDVSGNNYQSAVFIAPIVAASTCDAAHQAYLNSGWGSIVNMKAGYFEDTYNLLCQLYISGNWWIPQALVANQSPTVSITSPVNNATFTAPASVTINATAADADGTISKVEFYNGTTLLNSDNASPYSYAWASVAAGTYSLTAKAYDNSGAVTTSSIISITVNSATNQLPAVSITSPTNNATFTAPASITINATAVDTDGSISKVEFYNGTTLLGTDNTSPYSYAWTGVAAGTYALTAKATDNASGVTTSSTINIVVNGTTTPSSFRVIGYYPTWMNYPSGINNINLTRVTHINIAFANPNASGVLIPSGGTNADVTTMVNACHAKGVKVFMSIGGAGASGSRYQTLITSNQATFISNIVNYATTYNLDGIDVDIEGDILNGSTLTASQYEGFVTALGTALHAQNKEMTAALANWFANYVTNTAASKFDWINIMSYDAYGPWSGPGQHSPYSLAVSDFQYWNTTKAVPAKKLSIGVPFYGYGWGTYAPADNDEISYCDIVNTYPGAENNDQVGSGNNVIYYNGIPTIKQKTTYALQNAGGIMIWEIAEDCNDGKSLLLAIDQLVHPVTNQLPTVSITSPANNTTFTAPASVTINATAADADGTISKVEFYNGTTLLGTDNATPYSYAWAGVVAGSYSITAKAYDNSGAVTTSSVITIVVSVPQSPYGGTRASIPGTIQAENYDLGGQGVAYSDLTTANEGNGYRTDAVDIEATTGGGYNVGYILAGEWLKYMVNVTTAGKYKIEAYVATNVAGKSFTLDLDGTSIATVTVPNTGDWQTWQTVTINDVPLTTGDKVLRLNATTGDFNLDKVVFSLMPNQLPSVNIISPANNATFTAPASVTINATAADADGTISKVEFYNGTTLLNSDNATPYSYIWTNVAEGTYSLTAKAYDNSGAVTTSTAVPITVNPTPNQLPTVSITSPTNNAAFNAPASVTINATAADADGTISKVEFYNGTTLLNSDNASPYSYAWTGVAAGTYSLTAKAYDNSGAVTTSTSVSITVNPAANQLPTVSITSPTNNAAFTAPASVTINATVVDADGTISKVEFYNGTTLLNSDNASPYSYAWTNLAVGTYSLSAKAYDNNGATTTSTVVSITVNPPVNKLPTVTITSPANNATFSAPASITISATATDADGTISKVEFYNGTNLLNSDNVAPYSYPWTIVSTGTYSLTAKAYDNSGATTTSTVVSITVNPGSTGTEDCSNIATWNSAAIYVLDNLVTYQGIKYKAKWWTQNENPATKSGQWDVWQKLGECIPSTLTSIVPQMSMIPASNISMPITETLDLNVQGLSSGSATQVSYILYKDKIQQSLLTRNAPDFSAIWNASEIGDYLLQVVVRDQNGMLIYSDAKSVMVSQLTGIFNSNISQSIQVIPNPNNARFHLRIPTNEKLIGSTIEIIDMMGHKVYETTLQTLEEEIAPDNLKSGNYLLKVINGEQLFITKILVH